MGLGLGLGFGRRGSRPEHAFYCDAIEGTQLIRAKHAGEGLTLAPYAVFKAGDGVLTLLADRAGSGADKWMPEHFPISALSEPALSGETFRPRGAFDPADLDGVVCEVEGVDDPNDGVQGHPGAVIAGENVEVAIPAQTSLGIPRPSITPTT